MSTGAFSFWKAAGTFVLIVVGEIAYGIAVGWLSLQLRRWVRDPRVEITLSLMTPYVAFLLPAQIGGMRRCAGTAGLKSRRRVAARPTANGTDDEVAFAVLKNIVERVGVDFCFTVAPATAGCDFIRASRYQRSGNR